MGVEPYLAASSLIGVAAQRLVRRNCPNCSVPVEVSEDALKSIGVTTADLNGARFMKGQGCDKCGGSGFRGRQGVYELLLVDEPVRHMTVERTSASRIREHAIKNQGMRTLLGDGRIQVLAGKTTPEEVLRVCQREEL
jgi:type II secretory ATPase GspE/PulE/Tfp pilus assembly ATPase PilB-like protein